MDKTVGTKKFFRPYQPSAHRISPSGIVRPGITLSSSGTRRHMVGVIPIDAQMWALLDATISGMTQRRTAVKG